ncbi:MAG: phospholipase D family protein, partial [Methanococcaceae archaeon]
MLDPKKNRLDYGEQLIPPEGYELSFAVGTTYSLDLEALMVLPVALFYSQTLDVNPGELRYDMLEAITKAAEKITVYCQKGKINVPKTYHYLLAYWEKGIEEVVLDNYAQSFHPKVWVIRYEAKGLPAKYRAVVTSRNLTFARDWDVAFSSEGTAGNEAVNRTKPLVHFIQYIASKGSRRLPENFIEDLAKVDFDIPDGFRLINFFPIGIPNPETGVNYANPLYKKSWNELLVISPFVDDKTIANFVKSTNSRPYILSRKEELDTLNNTSIDNIKAYQFLRFIQEGEFNCELSEDVSEEPLMQNLHAKLFIGQNGDYPYWYLGSANATDPAFGRNVEFLIEIKAEGFKQRPKDIFKLLTSDKNETILFEPYCAEDREFDQERKELELDFREIIFNVSRLHVKGSAEKVENAQVYKLRIEFDAAELIIKNGYKLKLKPLPLKDFNAVETEPGKVNIIDSFPDFTETQLSTFIKWEIWNDGEPVKQFITQMDFAPPEGRLNKIFSSIINSSDKFIKYITFLLSGNELNVIEEAFSKKDEAVLRGKGNGNDIIAGIPL